MGDTFPGVAGYDAYYKIYPIALGLCFHPLDVDACDLQSCLPRGKSRGAVIINDVAVTDDDLYFYLKEFLARSVRIWSAKT